MHTHYSDGDLSPSDVVQLAHRAGLSLVAITDHDHTGGIEEARKAGVQVGVEVVSGVELSTTLDGREIHILGLLFDHTHRGLTEYLEYLRSERLKRAERIVERLNRLQVPLTMEEVLAQAGTAAVGRPHIATVLVNRGFVGSYQQAFARYLRNGGPAWEGKHGITPLETARLISSAGGVSFVAHPGDTLDEPILDRLITEGVDGIEVVHPSHSPERVTRFKTLAQTRRLPRCGGSDFHGGGRNDSGAVGKYFVSLHDVETIRSYRSNSRG